MTTEELKTLHKNQLDAWKYYIGQDIHKNIALNNPNRTSHWESYLKGFSRERILDYFEILLANNMSLVMVFQIRNNNKKIKYGGWIQINEEVNCAIGDSTVQDIIKNIDKIGLKYYCKNAELHKIKNEQLQREELKAINVVCDAHNTNRIPIMVLNLDLELDDLPKDDEQLSKIALSTLIDGKIHTLSTEQIKQLLVQSKRDSVVYKT